MRVYDATDLYVCVFSQLDGCVVVARSQEVLDQHAI